MKKRKGEKGKSDGAGERTAIPDLHLLSICSTMVTLTALAGRSPLVLSRSLLPARSSHYNLRRPLALCYSSLRSFSAASDPPTTTNKTALILGSSGCLGSALVSHLSRSTPAITVIGADCVQPPSNQLDDDLLDAFIPLPHPSTNPSLAKMSRELCLGLKELDDISGSPGRWYDGDGGADSGLSLDAIICASGGWEGDPPSASGKVDDPTDCWETKMIEADAEAHGDGTERMLRMNLYPVLSAGRAMDLYMGGQGGWYYLVFYCCGYPGRGAKMCYSEAEDAACLIYLAVPTFLHIAILPW